MERETRDLLRDYYSIRGHNYSVGLGKGVFPRVNSPILPNGKDDLVVRSWALGAVSEEMDILRIGIAYLSFSIDAAMREARQGFSEEVERLQLVLTRSQCLLNFLENQ